jgi:uncharacterized membrane protein (Fun14 family)
MMTMKKEAAGRISAQGWVADIGGNYIVGFGVWYAQKSRLKLQACLGGWYVPKLCPKLQACHA